MSEITRFPTRKLIEAELVPFADFPEVSASVLAAFDHIEKVLETTRSSQIIIETYRPFHELDAAEREDVLGAMRALTEALNGAFTAHSTFQVAIAPFASQLTRTMACFDAAVEEMNQLLDAGSAYTGIARVSAAPPPPPSADVPPVVPFRPREG